MSKPIRFTSDHVKEVLLADGVKPRSVSPYLAAWQWAESGKAKAGLSDATVRTLRGRCPTSLSTPQGVGLEFPNPASAKISTCVAGQSTLPAPNLLETRIGDLTTNEIADPPL